MLTPASRPFKQSCKRLSRFISTQLSCFPGWLKSKELSQSEFKAMCDSAVILEQDAHGIKVLRLNSGDILKIFRLKRFFSSARLYSYARRFCRNAERLHKCNVLTVNIQQLFHLVGTNSSAVLYQPLPGNTVRELLRADMLDEHQLIELGAYIARLHDLGIYFRSLHFGNIVLTRDNKWGLIDIADMRILSGRLNCRRRLRNFHHLCRIKSDFVVMGHRMALLVAGYLQESRLSDRCKARVKRFFESHESQAV
jgi:tRNA A-37 threonylcarbamoyl transferase component Bud32